MIDEMTGRSPSMILGIEPPRHGWAWLSTIYAAVILVAVGWPVLANVHGVHVAIAMVLAVSSSVAIVLAVRSPLLGLALGLVSASGTAVAAQPGAPWPWPVPTMIAYLLLVLVIALRNQWSFGAAAWSGTVVLSTIALAIERPEAGSGALANSIVTVSIAAALLVTGSALRQIARGRQDLAAERRARAEETQRRNELQERNRIAQELHDVVAHSMSVISVQATTAPFRIPGMSADVQEEFTAIARSARSALAEMRGLLSVLRGSDDADLAPQPSIADIPELVESSRSSGAAIDLTTDVPDPAAVPSATGLTAYRVVQEAMSNALRHAAGAAVTVAVSAGPEAVEVDVVNGPPNDAAAPSAPGAGLGLSGIRERVRALGGDVEIGPTPGGGFAVRASLPLG